MGAKALPPGFRFHPTDEELVGYYLKRKVDRLKMELEVIPEVELYKFDPWQLPDKSFLPKRDLEWFFFCSRDRKYPNGSRTNRATKSGYWKATGKDRQIPCHGSVTGLKKTLVFYLGRAPLGDRTDWVMHEYRLYDASTQGSSIVESPFALCRIVKRSEDQKTGDRPADAKKKRSMSSIMNDSNSIRMASSEPRQFSLEKSQEMNSHKATCDTSPRASTLHISEMRVDLEKLATPKTHTVTVSSDLSCNSSNTSKVQHSSKDQCVKNSVHMWQPGDTMGVPMFVFEGNYTWENLDVGACYSQSVLMPPCSGEFTNPQMSEYGDSLYQTFEIPEQHRDPSSQFMVTPSICRQASLDENFGEFFSLWLTEDSIAVM